MCSLCIGTESIPQNTHALVTVDCAHDLPWEGHARRTNRERADAGDARPKTGKPARIPVPKRKDVFRDLEKVAKPRKRPDEPEGQPKD